MIYDNIIAADLDLLAIRGDNPTYTVAFWEDEANTIPLDLTLFPTIEMQIKIHRQDDRYLAKLLIGVGLQVGGVDNNELSITVDTSTFGAGVMFYDITEPVLATTFLRGLYTLEQDVTR